MATNAATVHRSMGLSIDVPTVLIAIPGTSKPGAALPRPCGHRHLGRRGTRRGADRTATSAVGRSRAGNFGAKTEIEDQTKEIGYGT